MKTKAVHAPEPHFVWPIITDESVKAISEQTLQDVSIYNRSGVIDRVESIFERHNSIRHAMLTNSGTAALHSAYVGLNLQPGDEVLCPAYTFFATATPLFQLGVKIVLVDCDYRGNMSVDEARKLITLKTKAIVITHMWGLPCDVEAFQELADEAGLYLVEDISHAFGSSVDKKPVGTFGHVAAQSLQGQKPLTGGEGGVMLTNDDDIFYRALSLAHYNARAKQEIPADHGLAKISTTGLGLKLRIHPLSAALVEQQYSIFEDVIEGRQRFALALAKAVEPLPGIELLLPRERETSSWYAGILRFSDEILQSTDIKTIEKMFHNEGATLIDHPGSTCPLSMHELFRNTQAYYPDQTSTQDVSKDNFPEAYKFYNSTLKLPIWHRPADKSIFEQYVNSIEKVSSILSN